ncbi:hypothetical protein KAT51_02680 [bacterium]|nr:hypothetical protein [bacterium]
MPISIEEFGNLEPVTAEDDVKLIEEGKEKWGREYYDKHKERMNDHANEYYRTHKQERKEYNKIVYKKKVLQLNVFGEEGFSIKLAQQINKSGKIIGVGTFTGVRTPKQNRAFSLRAKLKAVTVLNEWFEGSEGHHMSEGVVIFISAKLHRSIKHNLKTGEGMDEINGKVLIWFGRQLNG